MPVQKILRELSCNIIKIIITNNCAWSSIKALWIKKTIVRELYKHFQLSSIQKLFQSLSYVYIITNIRCSTNTHNTNTYLIVNIWRNGCTALSVTKFCSFVCFLKDGVFLLIFISYLIMEQLSLGNICWFCITIIQKIITNNIFLASLWLK